MSVFDVPDRGLPWKDPIADLQAWAKAYKEQSGVEPNTLVRAPDEITAGWLEQGWVEPHPDHPDSGAYWRVTPKGTGVLFARHGLTVNEHR